MPPSEDHEFGYLDVLSTAVEALSIPPLPYCLIGELALGAYGRPRATHDVDLLILTDSATAHSYLDSLHAKGFARASDWHEANPMARDVVIRLTHTSSPDFPLDLIFATSPLHKNTLDRRKLFDLHGMQVSVSSAEDLIFLNYRQAAHGTSTMSWVLLAMLSYPLISTTSGRGPTDWGCRANSTMY